MRKMQKFNFDYDKENDDLFIHSLKSRSKGSIELGNIILDFNSKKELVGIEIMHASEVIKDLVVDTINIRRLLETLRECKVDIESNSSLLIIKLHLSSAVKDITPVISVAHIKQSSPALAYA